MANDQNLTHKLTVNEQREGGKKSGEARRNKRLLRDCLEILLESKFTDEDGKRVTGAEALAATIFKKALDGDLKAFELVRDTVGQKPIDKVVVSEVDPAVIDEVERLVAEISAEE